MYCTSSAFVRRFGVRFVCVRGRLIGFVRSVLQRCEFWVLSGRSSVCRSAGARTAWKACGQSLPAQLAGVLSTLSARCRLANVPALRRSARQGIRGDRPLKPRLFASAESPLHLFHDKPNSQNHRLTNGRSGKAN